MQDDKYCMLENFFVANFCTKAFMFNNFRTMELPQNIVLFGQLWRIFCESVTGLQISHQNTTIFIYTNTYDQDTECNICKVTLKNTQ